MNSKYENIFIPTYVINLKSRPDRLKHIKEQFKNKNEFDVKFISACENPNGRLGLWKSIRKVISKAIKNKDEVIVICEDDHYFTKEYEKHEFISQIFEAYKQRCDILSAGIGGFGMAVPTGKNRYWIDWFWCTQFIVVFKNIFHKILSYEFKENDTADGILSMLTVSKMTIYPFMSIQTDFGYSDVTAHNNRHNAISDFFNDADSKLSVYHRVYNNYSPTQNLPQNTFFKNNDKKYKKYIHYPSIHRNQDAEEIVPYIMELINPRSVVDIGCGIGNFLCVFKKYGVDDIFGVDGKWTDVNDLLINKTEFLSADLEKPIKLNNKYDLALCLEVAEHIDAKSSDVLVNSLVDASGVILFSAAIPGQGGQNHINEQWIEYWVEKFRIFGYTFYDPLRSLLWENKNIFWWYRQNMFIVMKDGLNHNFKKTPILNLIHPEHYLCKCGSD